MDGLRKYVRAINWFTARIVAPIFAWMIFGLMLLILLDVITRYLPFLKPLAMSDEFGGYALVAITMGGLGYAWQAGYHVKVEFFLGMIPPKAAWVITNITTLAALAFTVAITYAAWQQIDMAFMFKVRSNTWVRTVVAYPQLSIIVGLFLMDLQLLAEVLDRFFFGKAKPEPASPKPALVTEGQA